MFNGFAGSLPKIETEKCKASVLGLLHYIKYQNKIARSALHTKTTVADVFSSKSLFLGYVSNVE
jgi:hypothetical protein